MPNIRFNWVDLVFLTLLVRICYIGYKNGFLPEIFKSLGLLCAFLFSFNSYTLLSNALLRYIKFPNARLEVISFLFIFLSIILLFKLFSLIAVNFLGISEKISLTNMVIGLILSFGRALLFLGILCFFLSNSSMEYLSKSVRSKSLTGQYLNDVAPMVYKSSMNFYIWKKVKTPLVDELYKNLESNITT
jgi:uncharacterized membrane protein required for colicin V production